MVDVTSFEYAVLYTTLYCPCDVTGEIKIRLKFFSTSVESQFPLSPSPNYSWIRARTRKKLRINLGLDCKTVRIFAYSSTQRASSQTKGLERSWKQRARPESESETWGESRLTSPTGTLRACEARTLRARKTLTARFTDFFTDFEKKTDCFAV